MANFARPKHSRGAVDRAGEIAVQDDAIGTPARDEALAVVGNWRSSHGYPTQCYYMTLRNRALEVDSHAAVAQRLKRLPSIEAKLKRSRPSAAEPDRPRMLLTQMQDVGGCRAILKEIKEVRQLVDFYKANRYTENIFREKDYITNPKPDGYRCIHLIYKYHTKSTLKDLPIFNNMRIELQFRSRLQHLWATGVEIVDTFTEEALKFGRGGDDWKRFFALMSTELAVRERMPLVPGTPTNATELREELRELADRLQVIANMEAWQKFIEVVPHERLQAAEVVLLKLDIKARRLNIMPFGEDELPRADEEYLRLEKEFEGDPYVQVVRVKANSAKSLKSAYPNFYINTTAFISAVRRAIGMPPSASPSPS